MPLAIASLPLFGGTLAICQMPGRHGNYAQDLADLLAFGPALVVTMTTGAEMAAKGAAELPADLAARSVGWCSFPVADFGVPEADVDVCWPAIAAKALAVLAAEGRVLIHCMGGCGRSGMAALRLMVETGEATGAALDRLRTARPCAVETDGQLAWAAAGLS